VTLTTSENEKLDRPSEHQTGLDHNQSDEIQPITPVQMTADEARRLTNSIRLSATRMTDLLVKAYEQRAWAALDYISWEAYCDREFGNLKLRMPREERAETVAELREAGMSIRAIAAGTGLDPKTVHKDLKKNELWEIPTPETVVGTDGKKHPAKKKPARQSKREYIDAELKAMKAKAKRELTPEKLTPERLAEFVEIRPGIAFGGWAPSLDRTGQPDVSGQVPATDG
jgi:hypothetical protein